MLNESLLPNPKRFLDLSPCFPSHIQAFKLDPVQLKTPFSLGSTPPLNSTMHLSLCREPEWDAITPISPLSTGWDSLGLHTAPSQKLHQLYLGPRPHNQ